jgi:hypothetical protein
MHKGTNKNFPFPGLGRNESELNSGLQVGDFDFKGVQPCRWRWKCNVSRRGPKRLSSLGGKAIGTPILFASPPGCDGRQTVLPTGRRTQGVLGRGRVGEGSEKVSGKKVRRDKKGSLY